MCQSRLINVDDKLRHNDSLQKHSCSTLQTAAIVPVLHARRDTNLDGKIQGESNSLGWRKMGWSNISSNPLFLEIVRVELKQLEIS